MSKDMMPHFDLYQPDSVDAAVDLAGRLGADGWLIGGGQDSYDWLKNRTKRTASRGRSFRGHGAEGRA